MKLMHHIIIGKQVINWVNSNIQIIDFTKEINRKAYLIGCIAPDLNCIYPAHRLSTTGNRYINKIVYFTMVNSDILKSYVLGLITHYTCDYFCYAHNNCSTGYHHKIYEKHLINEKMPEVGNWWEGIEQFNGRAKSTDIGGYIKLVTNAYEIHSMIKQLNSEYRDRSKVDKHKGWDNEIEQCKIDMEFTSKAIKRVLLMLECMEVRLVMTPLSIKSILREGR